jgi:NAD(P)H-hydrate epimerase
MPQFPQKIKKWLPPRSKDAHKGDFGKLFILAGARGMTGAATLATMGALRTGAGLVTVGLPESTYPLVMPNVLEAMALPLDETSNGSLSSTSESAISSFLKTQDVFAVGPGLSRMPETQKVIRKVVNASNKTVLLDADGINAFVGYPGELIKTTRSLVITPHPGEFSRLFKTAIPTSESERILAAKKAAKQMHAVVVLKGYHTVVASFRGELYVNSTGNAGLAKGGSGDLLFGMIAALLAQKLAPFDAAQAGVYLHGLAADLALRQFGEISLLASDVAGFIPQALMKIRGI